MPAALIALTPHTSMCAHVQTHVDARIHIRGAGGHRVPGATPHQEHCPPTQPAPARLLKEELFPECWKTTNTHVHSTHMHSHTKHAHTCACTHEPKSLAQSVFYIKPICWQSSNHSPPPIKKGTDQINPVKNVYLKFVFKEICYILQKSIHFPESKDFFMNHFLAWNFFRTSCTET